MKKSAWLLLFLFFIIVSVKSQVGINTENPSKLSDLDVSNVIENSNDTIGRGIFIPRMSETLRNRITEDLDDDDLGLANGLLVYNLNENCFNYYSKAHGEWRSLCGQQARSVFSIEDCSSVRILGDYFSNISLGADNYVQLTVNVTKPGSYTITVMPNPANGYYFTTSGEFLSVGVFEINVPSAGTPTQYTSTDRLGDKLVITLNDVIASCDAIYNKVRDSSKKPEYTMVCESIKVNGVYRVNTPLGRYHTMEITLNVSGEAEGAYYIIETNTVDGISFSGSGILIPGINSVNLQGKGTPTSMYPKIMTVTSNSAQSVVECEAEVPIAYTRKRLLTIGSDGYNFAGSSQANKLVTTNRNFGTSEESLVKSEGFDIIDGKVDPTLAEVKGWLLTNPVDMVILGYNNMSLQDPDHCAVFAEYLFNGGVVLAFQDTNDNTAEMFLRTVLNNSSIQIMPYGAGGSVYQITTELHEVLKGPFGDIRGKHWGEDSNLTQGAFNLPFSDIIPISRCQDVSKTAPGSSNDGVTAFVHKTLNLLWVGDGGFNNSDNLDRNTIAPFRLDGNNSPVYKDNYGRDVRFDVYNSTLTANAIAWGIKQAQFRNTPFRFYRK